MLAINSGGRDYTNGRGLLALVVIIRFRRMLTHQFQHSLQQPLFFFVFARSIALRAPRLAQNLAGPTLAHSKPR
ncbi:MAG: hypothetical protein K8T25_08840, partial [Planctomycetia bacterium]|nr:hypothetical protein [Planctomycetia bacterium]